MVTRGFSELAESGLLADVEEIVVDGHRRLSADEGLAWSRPAAYHWLHYEDPEPVRRLREGVQKLRRRGVSFDPGAVDKACARASKLGFLN